MELPGPLLLLLLAVLADGGAVQRWSQKDPSRPSEIDGHIFGGRDAKPKEFPHMVSMQLWKPSKYLFLQKPSHQCGGALVAKNWVLTAAHCFIGVDSSVKVEVLVGAISLEAGRLGAEGAQRVEVARIVKHAKYDGDVASVGPYDIGMLKLVKEVQLNEYVQLAQLPVPGSIPTGDLILTGWGVTDRGIPDVLKVATLPVLPYSECLRIMRQSGWDNLLHETNVCNGPLNGDQGSCIGDSGGPLIQWLNGKAVVTAAVSWGPGGCFPSPMPSVNVRVSAFVDWIHDVMNFY